jgi:NADPH:quinone reductase-like Zn-dependent oxidoreductase
MSVGMNSPKTTMRAVVYRAYGSPEVLEIDNIEMPTVGDREVLIRVHAAAVNPADFFTLMGRPYVVRLATGLAAPRRPVLGRAFAGTVEAVGGASSRFQLGDEVYGEIPGGAYAEYVSVAEKVLAMKPRNITFEQAAAVPLSGVTALQALRGKGQVQPGSRVLINGASGGVGTFAVQIARALGAKVTAVCSTGNVEMVRSLGADQVVDYTREDFTLTGPHDVVLDLVGNRSLGELRRTLTPNGTLVLSSGPPSPTIRRLLKALVITPFVGQRMTSFVQTQSTEDLDHLTTLIEAGTVVPVLDRINTLSEAGDALRYQGEGHARGRTIITVPTPRVPEEQRE